jgi:hypothetical protein
MIFFGERSLRLATREFVESATIHPVAHRGGHEAPAQLRSELLWVELDVVARMRLARGFVDDATDIDEPDHPTVRGDHVQRVAVEEPPAKRQHAIVDH